MNILGIETSCDETALAIYSEENGLVANSVHSQVDLFKEYGGVVPEIAARDHSLKIIPLLENLLNESGKAEKYKFHFIYRWARANWITSNW